MKSKKKFMILWVLLIAVLFAGSLLTAPPGKAETIQAAMRDAVLHEENQISLFGWKNVNPGLISAMTVSAILLIAAAWGRFLFRRRLRWQVFIIKTGVGHIFPLVAIRASERIGISV